LARKIVEKKKPMERFISGVLTIIEEKYITRTMLGGGVTGSKGFGSNLQPITVSKPKKKGGEQSKCARNKKYGEIVSSAGTDKKRFAKGGGKKSKGDGWEGLRSVTNGMNKKIRQKSKHPTTGYKDEEWKTVRKNPPSRLVPLSKKSLENCVGKKKKNFHGPLKHQTT